MNKALVTVGIPVYNDEAWVSRTLQSVISQDYRNLQIIVADDCSTDKTREICRSFQAADPRIIFHENPFNIGALENHRLVFTLCRGEYFIWGNGHDYFDPAYISKCVEALEQDEGLQLCCGKTELISMDGVKVRTLYQALDTRGMTAVDSFRAVYRAATKNACIFYGVYRVESIRKANPFRKVLGGDLIFLAEVALKGNILQRDDITFYRQRVRPELPLEQATQRWLENIVQPEGHRLGGLIPWLNMAHEYLAMIINLKRPTPEQEALLATAMELLQNVYGERIQSDIAKLISINIDEISGPLNRSTYLAELIPGIIKARFFYRDTGKVDAVLHKCIGAIEQINMAEPVPVLPVSAGEGLTITGLPQPAVALYLKAQERAAAGDQDEALRELKALLQQYPDSAIAHNDLGVIHYSRGDKEKALHYYEKAVALDPGNRNFQKNLADFYFVELDRIEDAMQIYLKLLAADPKDIEALLAIGNFCAAAEKGEQAKFFFNRVLEIDKTNAEALKNIDMLAGQHEASPLMPTTVTTSGVECLICGGRYQSFLPFGVNPRPNALCPNCHSLERHRLLWLYLQRNTNFFAENLRVLDIAPARGLSRKFARLANIDYLSIDLNSPLAMQHMDITALTFPDNQFDCIFCYHVLEHIPDDHKAISELFRVLKPSGWAIIQVPVNEDLEKTFEDARVIAPKEREKLFGQKDHVRLYGRDYKERLEKGKFQVTVDNFVATLPPDMLRAYALDPRENIYYCRKTLESQSPGRPAAKREKIKVIFAVTETGELSSAGDYFTAMELALACQEQFGWDVELVPTEKWYRIADADVLVAMTHRYNLTRLAPLGRSIVKVCWMRNWFEGWAGQPYFHLWDIYLCSSQKACDYIQGKYPVIPHLLRLATNPTRFRPMGQERTIDYCFTGSYWNDPRDIEKIDPEKIGLNFALFGKNWEHHAQFKRYYRGFIPYAALPEIYNQARILVDDANRVTKQWGSVNSRVFDALAAGTLVITNSAESSRDVFQGKLPVYGSPAELREMLHAFTSDHQKYESSLAMLRAMVLAHHTYEVRALEFGEILSMQHKSGPGRSELPGPMPGVSIIIPVFNKVDYTRKCLEALRVHTPPGLYEVIVVDNASTDGTAEYLATLTNRTMLVMTNEKNEGFAKACNQGAAQARGKHLLFLNNDTEVQPGWLQPLIETAESRPDIGMIGSKLLYPDGTIQHAGVVVIEVQQRISLLPRHVFMGDDPSGVPVEQPMFFQCVTAACVLINKEVFFAAGKFDEVYWNGSEDVDLCFKIQNMGKKIVYQPKSVVMHHESKSGRERIIAQPRNNLRLRQKWTGVIKPDIRVDADGKAEVVSTVIEPAQGALISKNAYYQSVLLWWKRYSVTLFPVHTELPEKAGAAEENGLPVAIVVPVYNAYEETGDCLESLLKNTPDHIRLLLIDDCSTDERVWPLLSGYRERYPQITLLRHESNQGYTKTINHGCHLAQQDVILLNSDTQVTPGWLQKLHAAAYSRNNVATVTPLSNAAGAFSIPLNNQNNTLPEGMDIDRFAALVEEHSPKMRPAVPTGNGYCLYIRRDALNRIGYFDELNFPRGYGEENDFCMRCTQGGLVHLVEDSTFIYHKRTASFKENKPAIIAESQKRLAALHPSYNALIKKWLDNDPLDEFRRRLINILAGSARKPAPPAITRVLLVNHSIPPYELSGTPISTLNHALGMKAKGLDVAVLITSERVSEGFEKSIENGLLTYTVPFINKYEAFFRFIDRDKARTHLDTIKQIVNDFAPEVVQINDYCGMLPDTIKEISAQGVIVVRNVCNDDEICFLDSPLVYGESNISLCSGPDDAEKCAACFARNIQSNKTPAVDEIKGIASVMNSKLKYVRNLYASSIDGVIFSDAAFMDHFRTFIPLDDDKIRINARGIAFATPRVTVQKKVKTAINFAYIGHLLGRKGIDILLQALEQIPRNSNFKLYLYGGQAQKNILSWIKRLQKRFPGKIINCGPYEEKNLLELTRHIHVSIVPSYFETFGRVVRESLYFGIPVIVTDFFGHSIIRNGQNGMVIPVGDSKALAEVLMKLIADHNLADSLSAGAVQTVIPSVEEEISGILDFYRALSGARQARSSESSDGAENFLKAPTAYAVSIVLLIADGLQRTQECIRSIRQYTPEPYEIILVSQASTDGTVEWLRELTARHVPCRLIENKENIAFSVGCNQGISASSGKYILLLKSDVIVGKGWLQSLLECYTRTMNAGVAGPMSNRAAGAQLVREASEFSGLGADDRLLRYREAHHARRIPTSGLNGFCLLFSRSVAEKLGPFDERFESVEGAAADYCLRAELAACVNVIAGDVFVLRPASGEDGLLTAGDRIRLTEKWPDGHADTPSGRSLAVVRARAAAEQLHLQDRTDDALKVLFEAAGYASGDRRIFYSLLSILLDAKRPAQALEVLGQFSADPEDPMRTCLEGYCREGLGQADEADALADRVLAVNPADASANNLKGAVAFRKGDRAGAGQWFQKALTADPGYGEPHTNLGVLTWSAGNQQEAVRLLARGFMLAPASDDALTLYQQAAATAAALGQLTQDLAEAYVILPYHKKLAYLLLDALVRTEEFLEALEVAEGALARFGNDPDLIAAMQAIRRKLEDLNKDSSTEAD